MVLQMHEKVKERMRPLLFLGVCACINPSFADETDYQNRRRGVRSTRHDMGECDERGKG